MNKSLPHVSKSQAPLPLTVLQLIIKLTIVTIYTADATVSTNISL